MGMRKYRLKNFASVVMGVVVLSLLAACAGSPASDPGSRAERGDQRGDQPVVIEQSPNDDREYRFLTLDNDLRVLLVSDTETDKAAASLVVFRGSFDEPDAFPGLAHFLEHMLFIGTEKYPEVDAYQHFIAQNGGASNAYTAGDHTNYFFDIQPEQFPAAMDRFSQFFISPLLDADYVDREKNAVNSEYQMQLRSDNWRSMAVNTVAINPDHPDSRFSIGNLETLDDGVQEALTTFFEQEYSADQMALVALSNQPLDEMEAWIGPMFSQIENRNLGPVSRDEPLYVEGSLPVQLYYQTIKDGYKITYNFPVPATYGYYQKKPDQYISNLLGHEGEGSLYQRLKRAGWIESLAAGVANVDERNGLIVLSIDLTESGYANLERINRLTFRYIELLKKSPPEPWRYAEQARVAELGFRFQEQSSSTGFVYRTAPALMHYPPDDVLVAPYLMSEFDASLIEDFLARLTVDNVIVEIGGPDVPVDSVEPWFKVPYKLVSGPPSSLTAVGVPTGMRAGALQSASATVTAGGELSLPAPNLYLPADLQVLENDDKLPELRYEGPGIALWEDRDTSFGTPRANLFLSLGMEGGIQSAEDLAMASMYRSLVTDALSAEVYPAYLAGLGYGIDVNGLGFELSVSGYSDKQLVLLRTVLGGLTRLEIDPERFSAFKTELLREWGNYRDERPYTQTYGALSYLLLSSRWPPEALIAALENRSVEDLERWRAARMSDFNVQGLYIGNVADLGGRDLVEVLKSELPLRDFQRVAPSVKAISSAWRHQITIDHQDASMVLYLQDPDSDINSRAISALAGQMIKQSYFTSLRTEQQLGYVVSVRAQTIRDRGGLAFIVQSPVASPARLEALTREFLSAELTTVAQMEESEFQRFQSGLIGRLTEKDRNLGQRSRRYWTNLQLGVTTFDTRQRIAAAASILSKDDVLAYLRQLVNRFDQERLIVFNRGRFEDAPQGGTELIDVAGFKNAG